MGAVHVQRTSNYQFSAAIIGVGEAVFPSVDNNISKVIVSLDTASSAPLVLHERVARRLGLVPRTTRRGFHDVSGAGYLGACTLPWIDVAGTQFGRVRALIADSTDGALASSPAFGIAGWSLFSGRGLLLDWSRRRIAVPDIPET